MKSSVIHTALLPVMLMCAVLVACCGPSEVAAQEQPSISESADTAKVREVEILQEPRMTGAAENGRRVQKLTGVGQRVLLRQDETLLRAWHVTRYLDSDEILFVDSVLIVEDGDSLRADSVLYNKRLKTGRARGNVRLTDGEVTVLAPSALYYTEEKLSVFEETVKLIDSTSTLTSLAGEYFSDQKRAEFYGSVHLDGERTTVDSDSITYFRDTKISIARSNVVTERLGGEEEADSTTRTLLFGDWVYSDEPNRTSRAEGRPLLVQIRMDSTGAPSDTLIVRARSLHTSEADSLRRMVALDSVKIWQRDYAAVADSAVFDRIERDSTSRDDMRLFDAPMAWFDRSQVSGDTLRVTAKDGETDSLFVRANTFVAQLDTVSNRINQIKGQHLVGFIEGSQRRFTVEPNAETIWHLNKEERPDGGVQVSADRIHILFAGDKPQQARWIGGVQGTQYAENLLPSPFQLEGYRWEPDVKPTKDGLLRLRGVELPPGPEPPPQTEPIPIVRNEREEGGNR